MLQDAAVKGEREAVWGGHGIDQLLRLGKEVAKEGSARLPEFLGWGRPHAIEGSTNRTRRIMFECAAERGGVGLSERGEHFTEKVLSVPGVPIFPGYSFAFIYW